MATHSVRDSSLDLLRILAITGAVAIHAFNPILITQEINSVQWIIANIIDSAARWCVPVFVMISGALLIKPNLFEHREAFYSKRLRRIITAIAIWPIVYLLWSWFLTGKIPDISEYAYGMLVGSPAPGHLYFLFLILGLYILTPAISLYASKVSAREFNITAAVILILTALWHLVATFVPGQPGTIETSNFITQSIPFIGYYMAGYALLNYRTKMPYVYVASFTAAIYALVIASSLMSGIFGLGKGLVFHSYSSIFVVVAALSLFIFVREYSARSKTRMAAKSMLAKLASATYGVYLIHMMILSAAVHYLDLSQESYTGTTIAFALTLLGTFLLVFALLRTRLFRYLLT